MNKKFEDFKNNFKVKLVPSIIVTVSSVVLICGVYYALAVVAYPLPQVSGGQALTAAAWNNIVDDITDLNNRTSATKPACRFGGVYAYFWKTGVCDFPNPATGGCSCPAGYDPYLSGMGYHLDQWDQYYKICLACP